MALITKPDVSVIVPIYNSSKYLNRSLGSLHKQNEINAEFICVDDGSTDDSYRICQEFAAKDNRFIIIRKKHSGASAARNAGLDAASGKYVCFLDSDDRYKHGALRFLYEKAEEVQCDSIKFNAVVVLGEKWMRDSFKRHNELLDDFQPNDIFVHKDSRPFVWAHFIRRDLIEDLRFDESLEIGEDQEFIIRYMIRCKRVLYCSRRLYIHYNLKDSSLNSVIKDETKMCSEHIKIVRKVLAYVDIDSPEFAEWIFDTLFTHCSDDISCSQLNDVKSILVAQNVENNLISDSKSKIVS